MKLLPSRPLMLALLTVALIQSARCETVTSDVVRKGTPYETRYYIKTGDQPGPTVVLIGGVHGDEPAGYLAARKIAKWTITKGKLVVMPDAHREAIRRNVRGYPGNMNKMFPGKADGDEMERLAYSIWQMIKKSNPDLLITLHESRGFHADEPERFGQTLCYDFHELDGFMQKALDRVNPSLEPRKHKFMLYVKPYASCPTYQSWARLKVPATSIETAKPLPLKTRVKYQLMMTQAFFDGIGLGYQQKDVPMLPTARPSARFADQNQTRFRNQSSARSANDTGYRGTDEFTGR